ncbi:MAG: tetratricopeptide repeat protein [Gemmatimonadetes bacterium]|nr:tetratricopeptide repeat protein [Gemmatimonadota bacterium]
MTTTKQNWLLVGLVLIGGIALWLMYAPNQGAKWESYITAAQQAYQQADYAEAEKQSEAALKEAEAFDDVRLATSLNNLALLYEAQGRYAEAEPLYQRALAIREKALGPEPPDVATSLENYADLLRKTGRVSEATKMETRAKAIGAKQASDN